MKRHPWSYLRRSSDERTQCTKKKKKEIKEANKKRKERERRRTLSRKYALRDFAWASIGNYDARSNRRERSRRRFNERREEEEGRLSPRIESFSLALSQSWWRPTNFKGYLCEGQQPPRLSHEIFPSRSQSKGGERKAWDKQEGGRNGGRRGRSHPREQQPVDWPFYRADRGAGFTKSPITEIYGSPLPLPPPPPSPEPRCSSRFFSPSRLSLLPSSSYLSSPLIAFCDSPSPSGPRYFRSFRSMIGETLRRGVGKN